MLPQNGTDPCECDSTKGFELKFVNDANACVCPDDQEVKNRCYFQFNEIKHYAIKK